MTASRTVDTITVPEQLQLRMRAQLLLRSREAPDHGHTNGPERVAGVARHMLALQGQDWLSSRWALGVRAPGTAVDDVYAAFNEGLVVRSWPMRGTVHVVAAEDIGWIQGVTAARVLRGAAKRRETIGLDEATLERIVEVSLAALAGGARLTRDELAADWTEAGIAWQPNWRYHLVWWMCQNGLVTLGPVNGRGGEPLLVLADTWITSPRRLTGDEALCELAARYGRARGPVTAKDLAWWAGLTMGDTRRGFALAEEAGQLARVEVTGVGPHWVSPALLGESLTAASLSDRPEAGPMLLPAFDEHLLGYTERRPQLDPAHFDRIVPGRNGVFRATVVDDGVTVGTWRRGKTHGDHVITTPLTGARVDPGALAPELDRWARFHGFASASMEVGAEAN